MEFTQRFSRAGHGIRAHGGVPEGQLELREWRVEADGEVVVNEPRQRRPWCLDLESVAPRCDLPHYPIGAGEHSVERGVRRPIRCVREQQLDTGDCIVLPLLDERAAIVEE